MVAIHRRTRSDERWNDTRKFRCVSSASIDPGNPAVVRAHIEVDGQSQDRDAEIYGAVCLRRAESDVLRGENGGKRLHHVDVVQSLVTLGELKKGQTFNRDVELKLKAGTDPKNVRVIVFAQARRGKDRWRRHARPT